MKKLLLALLLTARISSAQNIGGGQYVYHGDTLPSTCTVGQLYVLSSGNISLAICTASNTWTYLSSGLSVPSGSILLVNSGSCPTGTTEQTGMNGKTLFGTIAANGDVGGTGGADSITPTVNSLTAAAQTISGNTAGESTHTHTVAAQTFSGDTTSVGAHTISWPANPPTISGIAVSDHASHTHTYTDVINHTHTVTSVGASATGAATNLTGASDTSSTTAVTANPSGGVAAGTTAGPNATLTHTVSNQGTIAYPANVPTMGTVNITPLGHNTGNISGAGSSHLHASGTLSNGTSAVTGTMNSFDNRSAYMKVIFCKAN